jgi:polyhydroxybutyrate depolymerase
MGGVLPAPPVVGGRGRTSARVRLLPAFLLAFAAGCAPLDLPFSSHATVHNSTNRSYRLYVPEAVRRAGTPAPLVLALHGAGSVPDIAVLTRIAAVAEREKFIVAFPQGIGDLWNDNALAILAPNVAEDVAFLRGIVDEIGATVPVDRARVYAMGMSNGGMMALRLACEAADVFAGVAAVAATMPVATAARCRPARPVAVMLVNGTHDPLIPDAGGPIRYLLFVRSGNNLSTMATMTVWAAFNGCTEAADAEPLPDRDRADGSRAVLIDYPHCRGAPLRLIRVARGGHTWPGGPQFLPRFMVGGVNGDVDASEAIWDFFKTAARR